MKLTAFLTALAWLAAPHIASAAIVETVSAERIEGELVAVSADRQLEITAGGKTARVPLDAIHRIRVQDKAPARPPASGVAVHTTDGAVICGQLVKANGPLAVLAPALGRPVQLDVATLLGVIFHRDKGPELPAEKFAAELARPAKPSDLLYVISDKGIIPFNVVIASIGPDKVAFNWDGQDRTIDTAKVAAAVFANAPAPEPAYQASLRLTDASVLHGTIVSLEKGRIELSFAGVKAALPMANVLSIEFVNPNVVYLSDLEPVEVREIPFFPSAFPVFRYQVDRTTRRKDGEPQPIVLDGEPYARGLGCHSKTVLTYDLGGRYKKFAAVLGIDDAAKPDGSVDFIVQADGKDIHSVRLTGRDKAVPVALDVAGVKRLILITDFADDANVGDHADWADARVMK